MWAAAEAHDDAADQQARGLERKTLLKLRLAGVAKLAEVGVEQHGELGRDGDQARRGGELIEDVLQAAAVVGEEQVARHASASRVASGVTKGLPSRSPPIHEPKLTSCGRSASPVCDLVLGCERRGDLRIEHRQRVEDGRLVVVERHANLIAHRGARDWRTSSVCHSAVISAMRSCSSDSSCASGTGMRSSCSSRSEMRRRLNMTERRATSVGCAVKTGVTQMRSRCSSVCCAVKPARRMARESAAQANRAAVRRRGRGCWRGGGACGGWSRRG